MADTITVKTNLPDFKRQMAEFGLAFQQRAVRAASNAAAQVFKKLVIQKAPEDTGLLRRSIYVARSRSRSTKGKEVYAVSFRKGKRAAKKGVDAFYGKFLEAGWVPRTAKDLKGGGRRVAALRRARGAGRKITAFAFLKPAFDAGKESALGAFNNKMEAFIKKESDKRR